MFLAEGIFRMCAEPLFYAVKPFQSVHRRLSHLLMYGVRSFYTELVPPLTDRRNDATQESSVVEIKSNAADYVHRKARPKWKWGIVYLTQQCRLSPLKLLEHGDLECRDDTHVTKLSLK